MANVPIQFKLNGDERAEFVESGSTLLTLLRGKVGDMSPKSGCQQGSCGSCSVMIDGELRLSCLTLAQTCEGRHVQTVAGLSRDADLHPLQQALIDRFASQCGFCTPGMVMAGKALLDRNPNPTRTDVVEALAGNICRCSGYEPIIAAVLDVARAGKHR